MDIRKRFVPKTGSGVVEDGEKEREFIFFTVKFNNFRDVSGSEENAVLDREEMSECECVLCLPESYRDAGAKTPLILSFHGAGGRVSAEEELIGGVRYISECIDHGYAVLDVCGSEKHGLTMGCPEHLFAIYKAYRYAIRNYNLSETVLVAGASMGGQVAMNFTNMFPNIVTAVGMFYPRLNMDGFTVDGHYCIGTWDKTNRVGSSLSDRDRIVEIYRFPSAEWCEENTIGFNPHRTRSFIDKDGKRVVIPPCPIKIWQGTADVTVDPVITEEYVNSVRRSGSYIEFHKLEGVGHKINQVMRDEIVMWFNRFI